MRAHREIANLIQLLDCESPQVRAMVADELELRVDDLDLWLEQFHPRMDPHTDFAIRDLVHRARARRLRSRWLSWLGSGNEYEQLESALTLLCMGSPDAGGFSKLLDSWVDDFVEQESVANFISLTRWLIGEENPRLKASFQADSAHYGNPFQVLKRGVGHPALLVCILMLCGHRLGLRFRGVHLSNQFLVRAGRRGRFYLFDCANHGELVSRDNLDTICLSNGTEANAVLARIPSTVELTARVLNGLIPAHHQAGHLNHYHLYVTLLNDLRTAVIESQDATPKLLPAPSNHFKPGQIIRHRRYGYRGVVVDYDLQCEAGFGWRHSGRNQPDPDQPWYHILVNDSDISAYAAQSNLAPDVSGREIHHPLIDAYFTGFENGTYWRNDVKWRLPHQGR